MLSLVVLCALERQEEVAPPQIVADHVFEPTVCIKLNWADLCSLSCVYHTGDNLLITCYLLYCGYCTCLHSDVFVEIK